LITLYIFMSIIICAYVWICIWHYAYSDFRAFDFFRVEGYAFKCLKFFKFLLSQTLEMAKKVALSFVFVVIHCVMMNFDGIWCGGNNFFCLCIPFKYAFMFILVLANIVNSYELFIHPALVILWVLLWTFHELLAIGLVWTFNVQCAFCL
jgi:hypothetical protein